MQLCFPGKRVTLLFWKENDSAIEATDHACRGSGQGGQGTQKRKEIEKERTTEDDGREEKEV